MLSELHTYMHLPQSFPSSCYSGEGQFLLVLDPDPLQGTLCMLFSAQITVPFCSGSSQSTIKHYQVSCVLKQTKIPSILLSCKIILSLSPFVAKLVESFCIPSPFLSLPHNGYEKCWTPLFLSLHSQQHVNLQHSPRLQGEHTVISGFPFCISLPFSMISSVSSFSST